MAAVAFAPVTLFDTEEAIAAFLDTADLVTPEDEQAFLADFETALTTATDKRDRVAGRLAQLEAQQTYAASEISRLQAFKKAKEAEQTRLEGYVAYVIDRLGRDNKGKFRKLEGRTSTMFLRTCPASVDVKDETAIPIEYRRATVTMPSNMWVDVLNALGDSFRRQVLRELGSTITVAVDKRAVKAAIESGEDVPGAKLITDKTSLGRK